MIFLAFAVILCDSAAAVTPLAAVASGAPAEQPGTTDIAQGQSGSTETNAVQPQHRGCVAAFPAREQSTLITAPPQDGYDSDRLTAAGLPAVRATSSESAPALPCAGRVLLDMLCISRR